MRSCPKRRTLAVILQTALRVLDSRSGRLVAEVVGDVQVVRGLPHRLLSAPVVAGRGGGVRMPCKKLLYPREIAYGVQEVADEGVFLLTSIVARLTLQTR
jgi:hypothetical protein